MEICVCGDAEKFFKTRSFLYQMRWMLGVFMYPLEMTRLYDAEKLLKREVVCT